VRTIWYSTREAGAVDKGVRRGGDRKKKGTQKNVITRYRVARDENEETMQSL
jgi:hypothetical protein